MVEAFGGRPLGCWFVPGAHDGLPIAGFPDEGSAAALGMRVGATGAFALFGIHAPMTAAEARRAMRKVKGAGAACRPPAG